MTEQFKADYLERYESEHSPKHQVSQFEDSSAASTTHQLELKGQEELKSNF